MKKYALMNRMRLTTSVYGNYLLMAILEKLPLNVITCSLFRIKVFHSQRMESICNLLDKLL